MVELHLQHDQELKQSQISEDVIKLNFRSSEGYEGFTKFVSLCDPNDKREGRQVCDTQTNHRYSHIYEGYWYSNSWCPLSDTFDLKQIKPDYPMLRLVTTQGEGKYKQPIRLKNRPDKHYFGSEKGFVLGTRQTIISIAKALKIMHKLPKDEFGNLYLEAISAMSPAEKYQWCYENGTFDVFAFEAIKYETPSGSGTPFIYLDIPVRVLEEVATECDLTLPEGYENWTVGEKWHWIKNHTKIPVFITEGTKKAASLISHGKIAIASFSITTHSEKATEGKSSWHTNLKPELLWLLEKKSGRLIYLVFDAADVKESSRKAVKRETKKLGKKLKKYGTVKIITWQDESCKGIDDFIVKHGIEGLNKIIANAIDFNKLWKKEIANFGRQLTADIKINQRYISPSLINQARLKGIKLLCVKSQQNTGKSYSYAQSLLEYKNLKTQQNISYQIGEEVKIKVGKDIYDSVILGYNIATKKYQCSYHEGYIERDINQIQLKGKGQRAKGKGFLNEHFNDNNEQSTINNEQLKINNEQIEDENKQSTVNNNYQYSEDNQYSTNNNQPQKLNEENETNSNQHSVNNHEKFSENNKQESTDNYQLANINPINYLKLPEKLHTYGLTHRQSLAWNLADRFNLDCYLSSFIPVKSNGMMVCADSSLMIPKEHEFNDMVIDESEQVAWHLLSSKTSIQYNRIGKIEQNVFHGKQVIELNGMITIFDANLTDIGIDFFQMLYGISDDETLVVENLYKPFAGIRDCYIYDNVESLRNEVFEKIKEGKRIILHTSGQKENSTHGTINIEKEILECFPELEEFIYRLDKESLGDVTHLSYEILSDLERLKKAKIVIASSSINTGVSLDEEIVGTFDAVFGIFYGNYPLTDFEQAIERYRGDCHRHVYLKNASSERINVGSYKYEDLWRNITGHTYNIHRLLQDDFNCDLAMDLVKFYCKFAAIINNDYQHLKDNFICHLEDKGYTIYKGNQVNQKKKKELKDTYDKIKDESETEFQDRVEEMEIPSPIRLEELEKKKSKTKSECIEEYKGKLARKYNTDEITRELIGLDREGFYPQLQLRFWLAMGNEAVVKRDKRVLTQYSESNQCKGYAIDFNSKSKSTQVFLFKHIGLDKILTKFLNLQNQEILILLLSMQFNPNWFKLVDTYKLAGLFCQLDVAPYLSFREDEMVKRAFKEVLNIDLNKDHSPIQLFRMILRRIGYKIEKGHRLGSKIDRQRYYRISDCVSDELWADLFNNWAEFESLENQQFENQQKQAA